MLFEKLVCCVAGEEYKFRCSSHQIFFYRGVDLAIIKVEEKIGGKPIALPRGPKEQPRVGDPAFVLGWGRKCDVNGILCNKQNHQSNSLQVKPLDVIILPSKV